MDVQLINGTSTMKYFVQVHNSVTPANKLQQQVLDQAKEWHCCLIDSAHVKELRKSLLSTVTISNEVHIRCKPLELLSMGLDKPESNARSFFVKLPMSEFQLCAITCTPVAREYGKEVANVPT